jgi:hypothetical protein
MPVKQLALAILRARDQLPRELQQLVTPSVAWTLAVLLISWRPAGLGGEVDLSSYQDVTKAFDRFADTLLRFRQSAAQAKSALDVAGASGLFISAVNSIGPEILQYLLRSDRFQNLQRYILTIRALPADVQQAGSVAASPVRATRSDRFGQFDNRPRNATGSAGSEASALPQVSHWRAQLTRDDLSPEMRWFYEQKLQNSGQPLYGDFNEAQRRWTAVLTKNELNPELRQYFQTNLAELQKLRVQV